VLVELRSSWLDRRIQAVLKIDPIKWPEIRLRTLARPARFPWIPV